MNSRCASGVTLRARIEAEYREMPGLSLTAAQAGRLWALDSESCAQLLSELIGSGFLRCGADGRYYRNMGGDVCRWRRREEMTEATGFARSRVDQDWRTPASVTSDQDVVRHEVKPRLSSKFADVCEAFAAIVGAAAGADGSVSPCETERIQYTFGSLPMLRGKLEESRRAMAGRTVGQPAYDDGSQLREAGSVLPAELRGTAFIVGIDVLLADGRLRASELRFVEELRRVLRVRRSFARKVLGVLGTKNLVWGAGRVEAAYSTHSKARVVKLISS